jgi:hypothetical protein
MDQRERDLFVIKTNCDYRKLNEEEIGAVIYHYNQTFSSRDSLDFIERLHLRAKQKIREACVLRGIETCQFLEMRKELVPMEKIMDEIYKHPRKSRLKSDIEFSIKEQKIKIEIKKQKYDSSDIPFSIEMEKIKVFCGDYGLEYEISYIGGDGKNN